jgi:hypothetical protein
VVPAIYMIIAKNHGHDAQQDEDEGDTPPESHSERPALEPVGV